MTANKASPELLSYLSFHPPISIRPTPSIHPSGLLQWQAGEFDREVIGVAGRELALRIHEAVLSLGDI